GHADSAGEVGRIRLAGEVVAAGADAGDVARVEVIHGVAHEQREVFAHGGETEVDDVDLVRGEPSQRGEQGVGIGAEVSSKDLHADQIHVRRETADLARDGGAVAEDILCFPLGHTVAAVGRVVHHAEGR